MPLRPLLFRCERDPDLLCGLRRAAQSRRHLVAPQRERASWRALLAGLAPQR